MKKIVYLAVLAVLLAACAPLGKPIKGPITSSECGGTVRGKTTIELKYRSKNFLEMSIKEKSDVGANTELRIRLKPKAGDESLLVKTIGKSVTPAGGDITWMNKQGAANALVDQTLILCVPNVAVGTIYKFDVEVDKIGTFDPRADVTW